MMSLKFGENIVPNQKNENKIERGLQKTEKLVYNSDCMITSQKTSKQKQNSRGRGIFMKKSLVLVMVLALVAAFAFADEIGTAALSTDKGVVTAGEAVNVEFSLTVEDNADDVTTIEVMGDEVSDNVFVMLIKDAPNDATYEAQKVVDQDAKKTTYFIKAKELMGTMGKVYAKLVNWKNETVAEASEDFEWKNNTLTKTLSLVPPVEGLYTVMAYIEFADGTRMELKGWDGYAQLVALDKYVKQTVPGLAAELSGGNKISVSAGVEYMTNFGVASDTTFEANQYLGVYGEGFKAVPSIVWSYSAPDQPEFDSVELVYQVHGKVDDPSNDNALDPVDEAYIKFLVMNETFQEGDCCATSGDTKWALWLAVGTGEYTDIYSYNFMQSFSFHTLYSELYTNDYATLSKGEQCRGWVKAIFYLDPSDLKIWLEAIVGTDWLINNPGYASDYQDGQFNATTNGDYSGNMLDYAELNFIGKVQFKDVVNFRAAYLGLPLGSEIQGATPTWFAEGDINLESDSGLSIELGGFIGDITAYAPTRSAVYLNEYDSNGNFIGTQFDHYNYSLTSVQDKVWKAHFILSGWDFTLPMVPNTLFTDSITNIRFGTFFGGDWANGFSLSTVDFALCLDYDIICCMPTFKIGAGFDVDIANGQFNFGKVFAEYNHPIGEFGAVTLDGKFGVIYSMNDYIDYPNYWGGEYGQAIYGNDEGISANLGIAYEVTGTMEW